MALQRAHQVAAVSLSHFHHQNVFFIVPSSRFHCIGGCVSTVLASRLPLSGRHLNRCDASAVKGISSSEGLWFGDFAVGSSSNLSTLIDTGSGDVIVNPGLYKPSKSSKSLNTTFNNTYGTTSSDSTGNGTVVGTLYEGEMSFGSLTATQITGSATGTWDVPGDGIVDFSGSLFWQFPDNSTSFMQSLCTQGKVSECRFGLALENENTGSLILGELDTEKYTSDLTVGPIYLTCWATIMDLALNGTVVTHDLTVELDSGTATIVGPIEGVSRILEAVGIEGVLQNNSKGQQLVGYFPCEKPPPVGFSFPSQRNASTATGIISKNSTIFDIPAST
ncbi:acid protease [Acephala macrosclerotiorum]|nr:acid protease [Acephala macrosclerotiorum]